MSNGDVYDLSQNFSGATKLDGAYPYGGNASFDADRGQYFAEDHPGMGLLTGMTEAFFASSHEMFVDYTPPGAGSQLVSLVKFP